MTHHRRRPGLRVLLIAAALAATPLAAACSDTDNKEATPATPTDSSITLSMPSATAQVPDPDEVGPAAGKQLCDMMSPDIDKWRAEGAAVARVTFNGTVHNWAARNGGLNDTVLKDRSVIDKITSEQCPDIRKQALEVLDAADLASALVGFGG
ncbi:hypothetical protein [Nocardia brasiliensis]|uniref:hypothetical protein n=1 Tax=Nocardia brasiliensis TaxID=37326 RepID=UPI0004A708D2|nr:hypothetical protein [Nocardia brasiliensis]